MRVLAYCGIVALGIPGVGAFKPEMTPALLPFAEIVIIQEPEKPTRNSLAVSLRRSKPPSIRAVSHGECAKLGD